MIIRKYEDSVVYKILANSYQPDGSIGVSALRRMEIDRFPRRDHGGKEAWVDYRRDGHHQRHTHLKVVII